MRSQPGYGGGPHRAAPAVFGLVHAAWRLVPLLVAEPTITVDYVSEYNRMGRLSRYDRDLDATPHYERFCVDLAELSEVLLVDKKWPLGRLIRTPQNARPWSSRYWTTKRLFSI